MWKVDWAELASAAGLVNHINGWHSGRSPGTTLNRYQPNEGSDLLKWSLFTASIKNKHLQDIQKYNNSLCAAVGTGVMLFYIRLCSNYLFFLFFFFCCTVFPHVFRNVSFAFTDSVLCSIFLLTGNISVEFTFVQNLVGATFSL